MRVEAIFRGNVQGVGFRYTAYRIARFCDIAGFVQNQSDGTVIVVAEGERLVIEEFLNEIRSAMAGYIASIRYNWTEDVTGLNNFEIRYRE